MRGRKRKLPSNFAPAPWISSSDEEEQPRQRRQPVVRPSQEPGPQQVQVRQEPVLRQEPSLEQVQERQEPVLERHLNVPPQVPQQQQANGGRPTPVRQPEVQQELLREQDYEEIYVDSGNELFFAPLVIPRQHESDVVVPELNGRQQEHPDPEEGEEEEDVDEQDDVDDGAEPRNNNEENTDTDEILGKCKNISNMQLLRITL